MQSLSSVFPQPPLSDAGLSVWWAANLPVGTPSDWLPPPTTGTVEQDEPEDDPTGPEPTFL